MCAKEYQREWGGIIKVINIDLNTSDDHIYIVPLSDFHLGDPLFDEVKLKGYIKWILEHNAYTFINGDIFDSAIIDSLGNVYESSMTIKDAKLVARDLLMPLKDRIIGMTDGNHERRVWRKTGVDISFDLAMYLGIEERYDQKGIAGNISVNGIKYTYYIKHGSGGGRTQSYKMTCLQRMSNIVINADLFIMSHVHDILTFQLQPMVIKDDLQTRKQTFVTTSSYLRYGGYAEDGNYQPCKNGSPRIRLDATKKDIHVSI